MNIWGIEEEFRAKVEQTIKNTAPEHLGLVLANYGACADESFQETNDAWMEEYLPELRFQ